MDSTQHLHWYVLLPRLLFKATQYMHGKLT